MTTLQTDCVSVSTWYVMLLAHGWNKRWSRENEWRILTHFNQRLNRPPVCLYSVVEVNWCSRRVVVSILRQFRFVFCDPNPHLLFGFVVVQEMVERNDTGSDEPLHKFPYSSFLLHFCKFYARAEIKFRKVRLASSIFKSFVLSISYFIRFKTHQLLKNIPYTRSQFSRSTEMHPGFFF